MLLRNLTKHVKDQNWFAVALDFMIVVLGVLLGMQFTNWNTSRGDETSYQDAMTRLSEESQEIWMGSLETTARTQSQLEDVQAAIVVLETCRTGKTADAIVDLGLNNIRSSSGTRARSDALDLLVTNEHLLERQTSSIRTQLRQYAQLLDGITRVSDLIQPIAEIDEVDKHPRVGLTSKLDPSESLNGTDVRRARIVGPLEEVCKDPTFLKMFYRWERTAVFELRLQNTLRETVKDNTQAVGLSINTPEPDETAP